MKSKLLAYLCLFLCCTCLSNAYAADKLTVLLDWFANPNHAPLFVAEQQGYFADEGLTVDLVGPADPADPPKLVAAKRADIAVTYEPQFMLQVAQGLPLIRIGTLIDQPLDCVVTLKSSGINTLTALQGKRIGYSSGGMDSVILATMLRFNHVPLKQVDMINVHYGLTQALLTQRADAITGVMRNVEVLQLTLMHHPVNVFYPEQNGVPTYSELIFVVHKDRLHDTRFKRFLHALTRATLYLKQHPEKTWQQFAKTHPALNNSLNHQSWLQTITYFPAQPAEFNAEQWQHFAVFLLQQGMIKHPRPLTDYTVNLLKD